MKIWKVFVVLVLPLILMGCTSGSDLESFEVECVDCNNVLHISSDFADDGGRYFYFDDSLHPLKSDSYCPICSYSAAKDDMTDIVHMHLDDEIAINGTEMAGIIYDYIDDVALAEKIIDEVYASAAVDLGPALSD